MVAAGEPEEEIADRVDHVTPVIAQEGAEPIKETVVAINRVTKVVTGGKRMTFSAVVVAGNGNGKVGVGKGKARDVQSAITKAVFQAKKRMQGIVMKGATIPFAVVGRYGAAQVMLSPACEGTGVIAGGPIRAVLEACGIKDILTKNLGTSNSHNVLHATLDGLMQLKSKDELARRRGKKSEEI
ncbi:MAG: 30S ribosomal protein S5 [Elusimicrobiota bacterium]